MAELLNSMFFQRGDWFWILEIALSALAWVILRCGAPVRPKRYRIALEFVLLLCLMTIVNGLCFALAQLLPGYLFALMWSLAQGAIAYFYLETSPTYLRKTKILLWLALYTASICIMSLAGLSSILVGTLFSSGGAEAAVRIAIYLLIPVVALFLRRVSFDEYSAIPANGMRMLSHCTVCAIILDVAESLFFLADTAVTVTILVANFCMFAMTCSAIQTMHALCRDQNALLELQAEKQRFLAEREMTQLTESKLDDLRCIRHDLKNQYSYMQILLAEKRYEELQQYFANLSENLPVQLSMIDCGNRTMNTVLNMELAKLKSDKIVFEHQLVVPPVLPFPDEDVCAIVTNLLDNAADECRRLLKAGKPSVKVRLEIYPHQSYLFIKCINSTDRVALSRAKGGLRTTKDDEHMHGYGTRIITKLAEKHNGCADYSLEGESFVAQVMLDMTEGDAHENQDRAV